MKINLLSIALVLSTSVTTAQTTIIETPVQEIVTYNSLGQKVTTVKASGFLKTPPLSQWAIDEPEEISESKERKDGRSSFDMENYDESLAYQDAHDPVVQSEMGTRELRAPIVNFQGMSGSGYPPDPTGAAGPNHYVQAVNSKYRVFDKTGGIIPQATFNLSVLWANSTSDGDPIVMYDRHADRWFISQFQINSKKILIAISETNDPTGSYYAYSYTFSSFPDYPKFSIWWDGYYMTSNSNHTAVAFDREKMLAGDPSASLVSLSLPGVGGWGFKSPLPADADGDLPPAGTPCYFFNLDDGSSDFIDIFEMTCDWSNTNNSQVVASQSLPVASFNATFTGGLGNIVQPNSSQRLDAIMDVFMYRAQHMRWNGYNTMMLSHAVNLGGNRSGVRWYELRDANDGNWTVYQSGTYAPDNTTSRWMSSVAMDTWGNIGMGYSISNATDIYPGLAYTGRLSGDVLGDMSYGEQIAFSGSGTQEGINRYGDYSHLSLDPDGKTFWYTGEYLSNGSPKTRIFSFSIFDEANIENPYYSDLSMFVYQKETNLNVNVAGINNNEKVDLNIIAMNGQTVYSSKDVQPTDNGISKNVNISKLESGVYFVSVGNVNFQTVERVYIQN